MLVFVVIVLKCAKQRDYTEWNALALATAPITKRNDAGEKKQIEIGVNFNLNTIQSQIYTRLP